MVKGGKVPCRAGLQIDPALDFWRSAICASNLEMVRFSRKSAALCRERRRLSSSVRPSVCGLVVLPCARGGGVVDQLNK